MKRTRALSILLAALASGSFEAGAQPRQYAPTLFNRLEYRNIGPSRGGRVTTVTGVESKPSTFYMGSAGGGVWKTTDYGQRWRNVSDGFFETGSIGAIRVAKSDPDTIYVGTGSDGLRSNVIAGRGVYKSTDAGKTWRFVGLENVGHIGAVEIHPDDANVVYVAAIGNAFGPNPERGVYRTTDGGETWQKTLFISPRTGAVDLELVPDKPDEIYACTWEAERKPWTIISGGREGGVYKSVDGGTTWRHLTKGLPTGLVGKSDLAVSPADPNRVYVLIEAPIGEGGLYRSDDRGESFRLVSTRRQLLDRPFYYTNVDADPTNADVLYVNSTGFFKSTDAGETWRRRRTPHGDNHDIWINPRDPDLFVQANDGGANVTRDGGRTWSTQRNQLTAELYQVEVDDQFPYWVYAGQQDNSTIRVPSLPPYSSLLGPMGHWQSIGGCETGPAVPKPGDPNIVYANCKGRFGRFNFLTGQEKRYYVGAANMYGHNPRDLKFRFQRVAPIHVSPHDSRIIYHASQYLHKTTDEGVNWEIISPDLTANEPDKQVISGRPITRDITGEEFYSAIYAVRESPLEKGLIWVGANDGPIHVTRDAGKTWTNVTPPDLPPGGRVDAVEPSPHRPEKAYVAVHRYLLDDWKPYIYRTNDYGKSWRRLSTGRNGIPDDCPTRVLREDPDREGLLYAGTERGMFVSFDDGRSWQSLQLNLPATPITDIKVHRKDLVLSTMGRSFWILDNVTPLHQLTPEVAESRVHLFTPREAYRMRYRPSRAAPGNPEYPPPGAAIDYHLAAQTDDVTLEILRPDGTKVRTISSRARTRTRRSPAAERESAEMQRPRRSPPRRTRLATSAGMHRIIWDLRHGGGRGALVSPGTYQLKLTAGARQRTARLVVLMDPRVARDGVTGADLAAQEALQLEIQAALSRARKAARQIERERKELAGDDGDDPDRKSRDVVLAEVERRLVTARGRYMTPMLIDQLRYLQSSLDRADQKPGRDGYIRLAELKAELKRCLRRIRPPL